MQIGKENIKPSLCIDNTRIDMKATRTNEQGLRIQAQYKKVGCVYMLLAMNNWETFETIYDSIKYQKFSDKFNRSMTCTPKMTNNAERN